MNSEKSKSKSGKMSTSKAFKVLGLPQSASTDEINASYKRKLDDIQRRYADKPDRLVLEADSLYSAYRCCYLAKDPKGEDKMLELTLTGPDTMLNMFGITDIPHQSLKVQMSSKAQYKDGQLVRKESNKTESFINDDGKRETKVWENGKLVKHTIDNKEVRD